MGLCVAAVLVSCNKNRPKYDFVLEEMSEVVNSIDRGEDDGQVLIEDRNKLQRVLNAFACQQDFESAPVPKDLWEYLWIPDKSIRFNNEDDTFICEINSEIVSQMAPALWGYENDCDDYPAEVVRDVLTELQGQYARSLDYSWTVSLPMTILFNRFTQQALRLCPDISLLTDQYTGSQEAAVIVLTRRYTDRATNILVYKDMDGGFQTRFSDNLQVDRVKEIGLYGGFHFVYYTDCMDPKKFQLYVMRRNFDGSVDFPLQYVDYADVLTKWLTTDADMTDAYFQWYWKASVDLVYGPKESQTVRTLHIVQNDDELSLEYDPARDEKTGLNGYYKNMHKLASGSRNKMVNKLAWAGSPEWEMVSPMTDAAMRRVLENEALGFSSDGNLIAVGLKNYNEDVRILDLRTREFRPFTIAGDGSSVISLQFSPDDSKVLVQSWRGRVTIADARTGEVYHIYKMNSKEIDSPLVFDWKSLSGYTAYGGILVQVDVANEMETVVDSLECINCIEPCGEDLLLCFGKDSAFVRYNPERQETVQKYCGHIGDSQYAAASPDGNRIVSTASDGTIRLWDAASGEQLWMTESEPDKHFGRVGFSPDGRSITYVLPDEYLARSIILP